MKQKSFLVYNLTVATKPESFCIMESAGGGERKASVLPDPLLFQALMTNDVMSGTGDPLQRITNVQC